MNNSSALDARPATDAPPATQPSLRRVVWTDRAGFTHEEYALPAHMARTARVIARMGGTICKVNSIPKVG